MPEPFRQIRTYLPEPVPANKNLFTGTSPVDSLVSWIPEMDSVVKKNYETYNRGEGLKVNARKATGAKVSKFLQASSKSTKFILACFHI